MLAFKATLPEVLQGNRKSRLRGQAPHRRWKEPPASFPDQLPSAGGTTFGATEDQRRQPSPGDRHCNNELHYQLFQGACPLPKSGTLRMGTESLTCRSPSAATSRPCIRYVGSSSRPPSSHLSLLLPRQHSLRVLCLQSRHQLRKPLLATLSGLWGQKDPALNPIQPP